jgi:energy-coupling factor transporter transmembrane protein EcfT
VAFLIATTVAIFAAIGDLLNWWDTNVFAMTLTVLIILAIGMIATVAINQFWLAAPFALLFLGMIAFLLITRPNLNGGIGEHLVTPVTAAEASRHQELAIGRITLDLTEVPLTGEPIATSAEVGLGELHVRVPDTAELRLDTRVGAGVLTLDTTNLTTGIRQEDQRTIEPRVGGTESPHSTITLHLEIGSGSIRIERVRS